MTNTNDFRRYSYQYDAAYAVDAFNLSRSSAVSKTAEPSRERKRGLKIAPNTKKKSRAQLVSEQKAGFKKALSIAVVTAAVMCMFFAVVFTFVQKNELNREIAGLKSDIALAQSENISLNAELEAMVSVSQIDTYAVEKLGMTRLDSNQIKYVDTAKTKQERAALASAAAPVESSADSAE